MHHLYRFTFPLIFVVTLLTLPTLTHAKNHTSTYSLGAFTEPEGERFGLEMSLSNKGDYLGGRVSATLYAGGNNIEPAAFGNTFDVNGKSITTEHENNELYGGFSGFGFVHLGQVINPYIGLGVFIGKTLNCSSTEEESGACIEDPIAAIYPEFGVEFNIDILQVTPYIRRYVDTSDSSKSGNVYGINFGLLF